MRKVNKNIVENNKENVEDTTLYPEMIPSLYNWINPDNQRERVRQIDEEVAKQQKKKS